MFLDRPLASCPGTSRTLTTRSLIFLLCFIKVLIAYGPILFTTILVHEYGHCLAARWVCGRALFSYI